jgi:hypothetical protein
MQLEEETVEWGMLGPGPDGKSPLILKKIVLRVV